MAPKPKTGGSFVKADTQTLSGGFKLTGNGGSREISPDGLESKLKLFLASSRGGTGYSFSLRGISINFRGNTLTPVTSCIH